MELIVAEVLSLIIVSSIVFAHKYSRRSREKTKEDSLLWVTYTSLAYLLFSILFHLQLAGIFRLSLPMTRFLSIIHTISIGAFILMWMLVIEQWVLQSKQVLSLLTKLQVTLFCLFSLASMADLFLNRLFQFTGSRLSSGIGVPSMLLLSSLYILIAMVCLVVRWRSITVFSRLLFSLIISFLLLSLLFFQLFRQPYLLALSNSFILLLSYLVWQRKELTLDRLTRIPNYQAFYDKLVHTTLHKERITLLMVDIENFRLINERYGTSVGDDLLKVFATFLKELEGEAYRLVGNRFALIFPHLTHNELVRQVRSIRSRTARGWMIEDILLTFYVNIAIVETPLKLNTADELVESLEFTLSAIKENRRFSVIIFNQKLIHLRQRRLEILSVLRKAVIDTSRVIVHYQPIIDVRDNRILCAEALMRLQDDRLGMISPGEFIPLAEQVGLITKLTEIVVDKVCTLLSDHQALGLALSHVSINISAEDLVSAEVAQRLLQILRRHKIDSTLIRFEVTESMLLSSLKSSQDTWKTYQDYGIKFLLDDFGTGYANLETLVERPFSTIKIDRSAVSNSRNQYQLLKVIAGMLTALDKEMVAEGVETEEQLAAVKEAGITNVQGYYFSKPVSEQEFLGFLTESVCVLPKHRIVNG
ncbi:MAG: bifunctional diguanylate cyclase/phosphodiesterase [Spirochaetales bacterium]|nr:bifunctional diguanylate cyclase/phosphodiesterase [Spirochaetales bacterium]